MDVASNNRSQTSNSNASPRNSSNNGVITVQNVDSNSQDKKSLSPPTSVAAHSQLTFAQAQPKKSANVFGAFEKIEEKSPSNSRSINSSDFKSFINSQPTYSFIETEDDQVEIVEGSILANFG